MAALVLIGIVTALFATEPEQSAAASADHAAHAGENPLQRVCDGRGRRLRRFPHPRRWRSSCSLFVVLYKFCDAFAGAMTAPFVIDLGFSRNDYAAIVKGVGLAATLIGGFAGGMVARALSARRPACGSAAPADGSNLVFAWQALVGHELLGADRRHHRRRISPARSAR